MSGLSPTTTILIYDRRDPSVETIIRNTTLARAGMGLPLCGGFLFNMVKQTSNDALFEFDTPIQANGKFFLKDIIPDAEYKRWFSSRKQGKIFILNKGRCGNGGTTGFVEYAKKAYKGLSIIVPNVSIVKSKEWDNDLCCLYGGVEGVDKDKPIRVCTWDMHKVAEAFPQFGMDMDNRFWAGSLLVVDEYHKLIDDSNFRPICAKVVKTIINTKSNVVLMSATPNYEFIEFLRGVSGKEVETYNIEYNDKVSPALQWMERGKGKKLFDIINEVMKAARQKAAEGKVHQVVFFYNSVKGISDIVFKLDDTSDVEVLCSKSNSKSVPCYNDKFNKDKSFHFMTSAFFTGMDVEEHIDKVVIIGGNSSMTLAYSNKEIKQMLGRMRKKDDEMSESISVGYDGSFIIPDGRAMSKNAYSDYKAKKERSKFIIDSVKDDAQKDEQFIQEYLDYLYYTGVVDSMEGWQSKAAFTKMMSVYGEYKVVATTMEQPDTFSRKRDISFNEYKKKRLKGETVPYRYSAMCEQYIGLCGLERFEKATRNEIERYVKMNERAGDVDIEAMCGKEKYDLFLGDGFYRGSYLMGVLDYLGSKCEYDKLEETMNDMFGCFCILDSGNPAKKSGCLFLCVMGSGIRKMSDIGDSVLYRECDILSPILNKNRMNTIKVSKKVSQPGQRTQCITDYLGTTAFNSLLSDEYMQRFYSKILEDPTIITGIKEDPKWKEVFDEYKKEQSMISEFYKDVPSTVRYPHKKDEMQQIDCLIVDIDDSISYNEFQALYGNYEYVAYPSISNTDPNNWRKFRVIFPLAHILSIPNDTLGVLKILRRMVCKYEDKQHNLGAFINQEQWAMRREHDGLLVEIGQETVVYLDTLIKSLKTYTTKFQKSKDGHFTITDCWSLERAIGYYGQHDRDDERHVSLFIIKNHLSNEGCDLFVDWLRQNHPSKMHHWLSHKRLVRTSE